MHGQDPRLLASDGARSGRVSPAAAWLLLIPLALGWLVFFSDSQRPAAPPDSAAPQPAGPAAPSASPADGEPTAPVAAAQAGPAAGAESLASDPRAAASVPEQRRSAEPAAPPPGQLRVCSADGRPLAGALLSWDALTADDLPRAWTEIALLERFGAAGREQSLVKARQLDGSDADGLAPDRSGQAPFGLLWVTHAEHLPRLAIKPGAGEPGAWAGAELRLEPGRGGLARVRLPAGADRAAFSVVQLALPLAAEGGFNAPERTARHALVRRHGLLDDGSCRLHAFGGPQLVALMEGERSVALCALDGDGDVELQPAAPLRLDLRLAAEPGSLPAELSVRLLAAGPAGPWLPLESARLDAEGRASVERPWPAGATRLRAELLAERLFAAPCRTPR